MVREGRRTEDKSEDTLGDRLERALEGLVTLEMLGMLKSPDCVMDNEEFTELVSNEIFDESDPPRESRLFPNVPPPFVRVLSDRSSDVSLLDKLGPVVTVLDVELLAKDLLAVLDEFNDLEDTAVLVTGKEAAEDDGELDSEVCVVTLTWIVPNKICWENEILRLVFEEFALLNIAGVEETSDDMSPVFNIFKDNGDEDKPLKPMVKRLALPDGTLMDEVTDEFELKVDRPVTRLAKELDAAPAPELEDSKP